MVKRFISKYALTKGVYQDEGIFSISGTCFIVNKLQFFHKGEYHETEVEANQIAEQMRLKRIESLKKQISKLEKLSFKP